MGLRCGSIRPMSRATKLRMAWLIAVVGGLTRLHADFFHAPSERTMGDLLALAGFVAALVLTCLPKVGNYQRHDNPRTTGDRAAN